MDPVLVDELVKIAFWQLDEYAVGFNKAYGCYLQKLGIKDSLQSKKHFIEFWILSKKLLKK